MSSTGTYTVGELIRELQRAVAADELDWESEILNGDLLPATLHVSRSRTVDELKVSGHAVIA